MNVDTESATMSNAGRGPSAGISALEVADCGRARAVTSKPGAEARKKIWIDLDNSPHVPFFLPIIEELKDRGCSVLVTARDCFQVCELADLARLEYRRVGRHYGKNRLAKLAGLAARSSQLAAVVLREKPDLAVSHGSRAQLVVSSLNRIPSIVIVDYEHARGLLFAKPSWVMVPEVIANENIAFAPERILHYPGIKEDVYVPRFVPDGSLLPQLGLEAADLVVTVRPPATEAHYHNPESEELFAAVIELLSADDRCKAVLLPRNHRQEDQLRKSYPEKFDSGKLRIPAHAVDGLNLIWHSDLVISGGGTMNREAAALGVPVYSIFRGKIGAVDRYLAAARRLVLVESVKEVRSKIVMQQRARAERPASFGSRSSLNAIVDQVVEALVPAPSRTY